MMNQLFQDASPLIAQPDQLRLQAEEEGFLFLKQLLPVEKLMELRRQILEILQRRNLLDKHSPLMEGLANLETIQQLTLDRSDVGLTTEIYLEVQQLKLFQEMLHQPELLQVLEILFENQPFPHPKTIGRIMLPHSAVHSTPPHQDFLHIQGTTSTWTAWFPLGDVPRTLGGLSVLKGSHKLGTIDVAAHLGAGGLETILCDTNLDWVEGDYKAGDVLLFHSQTVHKALPNQIPNKVRLSCDFRYQPIDQQIDPRSLTPHVATWEEIYQGWPDEEWKYYWEKNTFTFSEWDESIRWQKDKIC